MINKLNEPLEFITKNPIELDISNIMKEKIDSCWKKFIKDKKDYWDGDIIQLRIMQVIKFKMI